MYATTSTVPPSITSDSTTPIASKAITRAAALVNLKPHLIKRITKFLPAERDIHALSKGNKLLFSILHQEVYRRNIDEKGAAALHQAALDGESGIVSKFLQTPGVEKVNFRTIQLSLQWAIVKGHLDVVKLLLHNDRVRDDLRKLDCDLRPLTRAASHQQVEVLMYLLCNLGVQIPFRNLPKDLYSAYAMAAASNNPGSMNLLSTKLLIMWGSFI